MDGSIAAIFLLAGLTDMGLNHCGAEGCLAQRPDQARLAFSAGQVRFNGDNISKELYLRYAMPRKLGPFQPAIGVSITDENDAWVGFGAIWSASFAGGSGYAELSLMPGLYAQGDGPDLGHVLEFRSGAEIGFEDRNGWRWGVSFDHRSNGDISSINPGLETVQFRVAIPID